MKQPENKCLLIISPGFPKNEQDTTCLPAVQQFVLCYQKEFPDIKICIVSLHYPFEKTSYKWNNIDIHTLGGKSKGGSKKILTLVMGVRLILKLNREYRFNSILSLWLTDTALVGKIISRITKIPHLIWMHGQDAKEGNRYFKRVKPVPDQIAAISDFQNDVFYKAYGIKAKHVIPNGINREVFPTFNTGARTIDIFAAGNLTDIKRYYLLLEVVKLLKGNGYHNINVVIAGDGGLKSSLEKLIKQYRLEDSVQLLGSIPHAEVLATMNQSKLFLHTSSYEGHSTAMLEALYSGCIVLSFIPVSSDAVDQFYLCKGVPDMFERTKMLLGESITHRQILPYNMRDSVSLLNSILSL